MMNCNSDGLQKGIEEKCDRLAFTPPQSSPYQGEGANLLFPHWQGGLGGSKPQTGIRCYIPELAEEWE